MESNVEASGSPSRESEVPVAGQAPSDCSLCEDDSETRVDVTVAEYESDSEVEHRAGSGRLSYIIPTLGRMANTAHKFSAPYLSYAAMASQEAARYTTDHAKRYVDKVQAQHRRGEAPPGLVDPAKVDWSGVGARFCSLSWYDRQLVSTGGGSRGIGGDPVGYLRTEKRTDRKLSDASQDEEGAASCQSKSGADGSSTGWRGGGSDECGDAVVLSPKPRAESSDGSGVAFDGRERKSDASVMATLKDLDPWVTSPLFDDECNAMASLEAMVASGPPFGVGGSDRSTDGSAVVGGCGLEDYPSPVRVISGDGLLDRLCESWEGGQVTSTCPAEEGADAGMAVNKSSPTGRPSLGHDAVARGMREQSGARQRAAGKVVAMDASEQDVELAPDVGEVPPVGVVMTEEGLAREWRPGPAEEESRTDLVECGVSSPEDEVVVKISGQPLDEIDVEYATASYGAASLSHSPPPAPPSREISSPSMMTQQSLSSKLSPRDGDIALRTSSRWDIGPAVSPPPADADVACDIEAGGLRRPGTVSSHELLLDWLRREASAGDEEAQFHLAQLFSPPRFEMKMECRECGEPFGVTRYRHHCRHCGGSFCHEHSWHVHPIPKLGLPTAEDTGVDKALRVVDGAIYVAKAAPLGTAVKVSVEVMDLLMKYGTAGVAGLVLRREFVEAVDVLKRLSGVDKKWPMSVHEMTAAMYYLLAQRRGERGADPNGEHEAHKGCPPVSDEQLSFLRGVAALPLHFAYTKTALELQVLCNTIGWSLVFYKAESRFHQPAFSLLASRATMTAALVIRGTGSVHDVITDIQAIPVPFPPPRGEGAAAGEEADGWSKMPPADTVACCGMARAAEWLHREVVHHLVKLHREGHKIVLLGHSLGGGVAALMGCLVKEVIPDVRVVAFATPACADMGVAKLCDSICTSVILHDDVVPRVTPQAVRALLKDALCTKEGWVKHLYDDWDAVVGRAKDLWAPRWRMASRGGLPSAGVSNDGKPAETTENPEGEGEDASAMDRSSCFAEVCGSDLVGSQLAVVGRPLSVPCAAGEADVTVVTETHGQVDEEDEDEDESEDEWGGRGRRTPGSLSGAVSGNCGRGDEGGVTVPESAGGQGGYSGSSRSSWRQGVGRKGTWARARWAAMDVRAMQSRLSRIVDDTSARIRSSVVKDSEAVHAGIPGGSSDAKLDDSGETGEIAGNQAEEEVEVVEELPLPELYVPGRIIHIYSQRGAYRGCEIPRDHEVLRTIPMYGNMLSDHGSQAYFDALEEVANIRVAEANGQVMPDWVPFSASEECQLCKADFSWASTSRSEAQRQRDKHNCRMCGLLVCHPCSRHRKPLPQYGVLEPSRVCDRCFYGADPSRVGS